MPHTNPDQQSDWSEGCLLEQTWLTVEQAAALCAVEPEWLAMHLDQGLCPPLERTANAWCWSSTTLARVRRMRGFERDFDAAPELAALMADLLEEMDQLRSRLRRWELG